MRLFIALDIPDRTRKLLAGKIDRIREQVKQDLKWVEPANWHLTLKFLGETEEAKIDDIEEEIRETAGDFNRFPLLFRGLGAFPALNHPRVIYVDIDRGGENLCQIHGELESGLTGLGFAPEEREYNPHLTVARSRKSTDTRKLAEELQKFRDRYFINIHMEAAEIKLIKSELTGEGPIYTDIYTAELK